jgi:hypothetical protein
VGTPTSVRSGKPLPAPGQGARAGGRSRSRPSPHAKVEQDSSSRCRICAAKAGPSTSGMRASNSTDAAQGVNAGSSGTVLELEPVPLGLDG